MKSSTALCELARLSKPCNDHLTIVYSDYLKNLSDKQKVVVLAQTFPGLNQADMKRILKKCRGLLAHAIDTLLCQVFSPQTRQKDDNVEALIKTEPKPILNHSAERKAPSAAPSTVLVEGPMVTTVAVPVEIITAFPVAVSPTPKGSPSMTRTLRSRAGVRLSPKRRLKKRVKRGIAKPEKLIKETLVQPPEDIGNSSIEYRSEFIHVPTPTPMQYQVAGESKSRSRKRHVRKKDRDGKNDSRKSRPA